MQDEGHLLTRVFWLLIIVMASLDAGCTTSGRESCEEADSKRPRKSSEAGLGSYDFCQSTEENHAATSASDGMFVGDFKEIRSTLDYDYHKKYSVSRQLLQDDIVRRMLRTIVQDATTRMFCERPRKPWVIFTAGPMGAGKSRFMKWVSQKGYFPLASFVQVDPDVIRYDLPEMVGYLERDRTTAGTYTHKEAGFIQEVLTLEGMRLGKNVIVDGSLHDADWNGRFFARIRKEYPNVQIGIIHMTCEPDEVLRRASRRAETTGRVVPRKKLLQTIEQVPKSVGRLAPLANYTITINTDGIEPVVDTDGESWETFAQQWFQECEDDEAVPSLKLLKGFIGGATSEPTESLSCATHNPATEKAHSNQDSAQKSSHENFITTSTANEKVNLTAKTAPL